jgi:hypothetical protein
MSDADQGPLVPELPGGPYDLEFFFDAGCPYAWQTSVWVRRVQELRKLKVGWRFISLKFINEKNEPAGGNPGRDRGLRFHRVCAAAREQFGNDAVGTLYETYGNRYWYVTGSDPDARRDEAAKRVDLAEVIAAAGLPASLIEAADDDGYDAGIRAESDEAFRRTGPDVGTPIITYDPPNGNSLFGPVISTVPDDEASLAFYDALRTLVDFPAFSELKRSSRYPLDLPLLQG